MVSYQDELQAKKSDFHILYKKMKKQKNGSDGVFASICAKKNNVKMASRKN